MRRARGFRAAVCGAWLAVLLTGCSEYGYPSAVFLVDGTPTVAIKRCADVTGIAKLAMRRGRYGDKQLPEVWVARLQPGATPLFEIPLSGSVPGYTITIRSGFEPNSFYTPEADDTRGHLIGGPAFRFTDLVPERVIAYDAGTEDRREFSLRNWRLTKEDCPERRNAAATEFGSFGLLLLIPLTITAAAFALDYRRRRRRAGA